MGFIFPSVLNNIVADDRSVCRSVNKQPQLGVVAYCISLERDVVSRHGFGLASPINSALLVADHRVLAHEVLTVLVTDGHATAGNNSP